MKVEIEITKEDLRSIFCAAIRNYYRNVKMRLEPNTLSPWQPNWCDEDITDNLQDICDACNAISDLCNMIDELNVADNDARGVIRFGDSEDEEEVEE